MSTFTKTWFMVPYHIRKLPGMTLALLDFYETIFEFWNNGQQCFLTNKVIMERIGVKSVTTIHDAFTYFETQNAMKRVYKNGKRYIVQVLRIECETEQQPVDNSEKSSAKSDRGTSAVVGGDTSVLVGGDTSAVVPINNKININNLNKSFCDTKTTKSVDNSKRHSWATTPSSGFADVTKQSTSFKPCEIETDISGKNYQEVINSNPFLKRKYAEKNSEQR